jgi:hypothetical protein
MSEYANILKMSVKQFFDAILSEIKPKNWREVEKEKEKLLKEKPPVGYLEAYQKLLLADSKIFLRHIRKQNPNPLDELDLKSALKQLEQISKKFPEQNRTTLEKWANSIGKFFGYKIDKEKTTAFEFLVATQQLNEHIEHENKNAKQQKNGG